MATQPELSDEQRANLATLAAYLRTLPAEYPDFEMSDFTICSRDEAYVPECGTAACAVGHGPHAGFEPNGVENWWDYSERLFIPDGESEAWQWCFGGSWHRVDNTAHGAAARIDWFLAHGTPDDSFEQRIGDAPLCYRAGAL